MAEGRQFLLDLISSWLIATNRPIKGRPRPRARDMAVRKANELMEQADWSEFSMATLQYAFRERFGMTPAAFVKARRLILARRELALAANGETTVGAVMAKVGFTHAGQFACDYRRSFNELPSETLERKRSAGEGDFYRAPFE